MSSRVSLRWARYALVCAVPISTASAQPVLNVVAKSGDPVPNVADRTFYNIGSAYINNAGDIAFQANLGNASGQFVSRGALVRRQGVLRLIAQVGDAAPSGFPGSVFQDASPSVSNMDEQGNVLLTSVWSNQFGTQGYGTHVDTPDGSFVTIDPLTPANPQWPALWTQHPGTNFRMGGGFMVFPQWNEIHGGPVTGPMSVLWQNGRPAPGWPCASAVDVSGTFNSMSATGMVLVHTPITCGTWCGGGACASAIYHLSAQSGGITEMARSCPEGAGTPSGPVQCGLTGTRSINNAFTSLSGRTTWQRQLFNFDLILVRDGVDVGSLLAMATQFFRPGEEAYQSPSASHIGQDGTIFVNYSTRPISGGGLISVGAFAVNPDGSTTHIGRYNEPIFPGGPLFSQSLTSAANASGIMLQTLFDGLYSWDRVHGWQRIIGPGDQVRLGPGEPVVSVVFAPSVVTGYQAGAGRGINDSDVVAVTLDTQIVGTQTRVYAVALIDLSPPVCTGDVTGDGLTNISDFNMLASNFGAAVPAGTLGDLTGNGFVDIADFNILAGNFGCEP